MVTLRAQSPLGVTLRGRAQSPHGVTLRIIEISIIIITMIKHYISTRYSTRASQVENSQ